MHTATLAIQTLSIYQPIKTVSPLQNSYSALDGTSVQWQRRRGRLSVCLNSSVHQSVNSILEGDLI